MIEVRAADADEEATWSAGWQQRLHQWYGSWGASDAWVVHQVRRRTDLPDDAVSTTYVLLDDGRTAGFLVVRMAAYGPIQVARITDVWVDPAHRRQGIATAARVWAERWARAGERPLLVAINAADVGSRRLFATYPVAFQTMMKHLPAVATTAGELTSRPMTGAEFSALRDGAIRGFAEETAACGLLSRQDAMTRSMSQFEYAWPDGLASENCSFLTLCADTEPVARVWVAHHAEPANSYVCYVEVDGAHRGRGYGRAAMAVAELAGIEAGDTHIGLNVFGRNTVAINLYTAIGYQVVEQGRLYGAP